MSDPYLAELDRLIAKHRGAAVEGLRMARQAYLEIQASLGTDNRVIAFRNTAGERVTRPGPDPLASKQDPC